MSDEGSSKKEESVGGIIKQTIDSATALTKAIPIYEDALQPVAKETGKALGTLGKAINVALAPISLVIWSYDKIGDFLESKVAEKLENIPTERIITPAPNVVGPAVEALKFTGHDETLQDLFANLIANSLDSKTALEAHPSFVDIIKNITPDEGYILKSFINEDSCPLLDVRLKKNKGGGHMVLARNISMLGTVSKCVHLQLVPNYIDNLCRLGILEIPSGSYLTDNNVYKYLIANSGVENIKKQYENNKEHSIDFENKVLKVTGIGRQFINACVLNKQDKV